MGMREGERLAGAGLAAAENVATVQGVGQGVDLDREWGVIPLALSAATRGAGTPSAPKGDSVKVRVLSSSSQAEERASAYRNRL